MAAVVAFFGSSCLGEILASEGKEFSPSSDLTWSDVQATIDNAFLSCIKQRKSGEKEGKYVDIFSFSGYHCCPVKALKKLRELQKSARVYNPSKPVFTYGSGAYTVTRIDGK